MAEVTTDQSFEHRFYPICMQRGISLYDLALFEAFQATYDVQGFVLSLLDGDLKQNQDASMNILFHWANGVYEGEQLNMISLTKGDTTE